MGTTGPTVPGGAKLAAGDTDACQGYIWAVKKVLVAIAITTLAFGQWSSTSTTQTTVPRFAYVPNRSTKNVSAFTINAASGALSAIPGSPFFRRFWAGLGKGGS